MEYRNRGHGRIAALLARSGRALLPLAIVAIAAGTAAAQAASDGSIGIYFDPDGTLCQGTIAPGPTGGFVYVLAKLAGQSAGGIAGSEFRFTGVPASWEVFPVANRFGCLGAMPHQEKRRK